MNIAIFGYGVIGKGIVNVLDTYNPYNIRIEKIFDRIENKDKIGSKFTNNYLEVMEDKKIDTIMECMGGNLFPYEIIKSALIHKKNVVTSNKEVVSLHLKEFLKLAKENNVKFLFEASCGGGVPIINSLIENRKVNPINSVIGILNGTTNFILSRIEEGMEFSEALKLAQAKGFAEADPTADLEGLDMVRKISIISDIIFDTFIDINKVKHFGIRNVNLDMFKFLNEFGLTIKFASLLEKENNELHISVNPVIVQKNSLLGSTKDEFNMILFNGLTNGKLGFYGKGAGALPTASAMVSDLIKIIEDSYNLDLEFNENIEIKDINKKYKYFISIDDNYKIDNELIEYRSSNNIITKLISNEEFLKISKHISFYGLCLD